MTPSTGRLVVVRRAQGGHGDSYLWYQETWQRRLDDVLQQGLWPTATTIEIAVLRQCIRQARKGDGGRIYAKVSTLAALIGARDKAIRQALRELVALGFLRPPTRTPRFQVFVLGQVLLDATAHLTPGSRRGDRYQAPIVIGTRHRSTEPSHQNHANFMVTCSALEP